MPLPLFLTVAEVAAYLKLSESAVRRAIRAGELAATKPRGQLRISEDAVAAWLAASAVQPDVVMPRRPRPQVSRTPSPPAPAVRFRDRRRSEAASTSFRDQLREDG
jgi:excisionase family DNA binding protein